MNRATLLAVLAILAAAVGGFFVGGQEPQKLEPVGTWQIEVVRITTADAAFCYKINTRTGNMYHSSMVWGRMPTDFVEYGR